MIRILIRPLIVLTLLVLTGCQESTEVRPPENGAFASPEGATAPPGSIRSPAADEQIGEPVRATTVDGIQEARLMVERDGIEPIALKIRPGTTAVLTFVRHDPEACSDQIILPALDVETPHLPLGEDVTIEFTPTRSGVFMYHCGVERLSGRLIVQR